MATSQPVVLLSGGLDSTVTACLALRDRGQVQALTVDYGQRGRREIRAARAVARTLHLPHRVVSARLPWPDAELVATSKTTPSLSTCDDAFLPGRNLFLIGIAAAVTACRGDIYIGTNAQDLYPDATERFFADSSQLIAAGNRDADVAAVVAPLISLTKAEVVTLGLELGAPLDLTRSCYQPLSWPCGHCLACLARAGAFAAVRATDRVTRPSRWSRLGVVAASWRPRR